MIRGKTLSFLLLLVVTPILIFLAVILIQMDLMVSEKFASRSFLMPTQFYSTTLELLIDDTFSEAQFKDILHKNNYREKAWGSVLQKSDYSQGADSDCEKLNSETKKCFAFHHHVSGKINVVGIDEEGHIHVLMEVDAETQESRNLSTLSLFPRLFAQYLGSSPVIQQQVPLSQIPRQCLDAALSIEDPLFLEHQGVSYKGLARAMWVNLKSGRWAQGGSTITQQLVKNYFLTAERRLSRKIKELFLALVVEHRIPKDEILETYLNIIYLGQQGNFQVRGYPAASRFYFQKNVETLNLAECALLSAIINNPGQYNPFSKKENAVKRRQKVLQAMLDQNRILKEDFDSATNFPLPVRSEVEIKETAPYFIEGVVREMASQGYRDLSGYKIYTTLDLKAQAYAQKALQEDLNQLETASAYHQKNKSHSLQGVVVSSHPQTGEVLALVGGRDHRTTPFNRVFDSHRQVGSIFKPLVYLTALYEDSELTPLSLLDNSPFKYKYQNQTWEPQNYDKSTSPPVPLYYALKESLNIPTARLAIDVGLDKIISVAHSIGVQSQLQAVPSLSLGAFELTPFEVLQVYTNIARTGFTTPLRLIKRVENSSGDSIYSPEIEKEQVLTPEDFVTLTSMLRETMKTGTAQSVKARGFNADSAGKTGSTSQMKDSWFAGFTSNQVTIVWLGYDDNTPVNLSGAAGALPVWTEYMKSYYQGQDPPEFKWDFENLSTLSISHDELLQLGLPENKAIATELLYYKK